MKASIKPISHTQAKEMRQHEALIEKEKEIIHKLKRDIQNITDLIKFHQDQLEWLKEQKGSFSDNSKS